MLSYLVTLQLTLSFIIPICNAAFEQQTWWTVPDGTQPDLTDTYYGSQTVPLSWTAMNNAISDLWVTSFDWANNQYAALLQTSIDLSVAGSYNWLVTIAQTDLASNAEYVLRMKAHNAYTNTYSNETVELSSPGFLVLPASSNPQPSATSTTQLSTTSMQSVISASAPASTTAASAPESASASSTPSSLSSGAKGGIGAGVAVLALAVIGIIALFIVRHRRQRRTNSTSSDHHMSEHAPLSYYSPPAGGGNPPGPYYKSTPNTYQPPSELDSSQVRPLHELDGGQRSAT